MSKNLPVPISDISKEWEAVTVDLKCRWCQKMYKGERWRYFLTIAKREGRKDPWWWGDCPGCQARENERQRQVELELEEHRRQEAEKAFEPTRREGDYDDETGRPLGF